MRLWLALLLAFGAACDAGPRPARATSVPGAERGSDRTSTRRVVEAEEERSRARLRLVVVAAETGAPLSGVEVQVSRPDPERSWVSNVETCTPTDEPGACVIELEPGCWNELTLVYADSRGRERFDIAPSEPGEEREFEVALPTRLDAVFVGQVIDALTREPLPDAAVSVNWAEDRPLALDGLGRFRFEFGSWMEGNLQVEHAGYVPEGVSLEQCPEDPGEIFVIPLHAPASLELVIHGTAGHPLADAEVVLSDGRELGRRTTSATGLVRFEDVLPLTWMADVVVVIDGEPVFSTRLDLRSPGDLDERLTLRVPERGVIEGSVRTPEGQVVPHAVLWYRNHDGGKEERYFHSRNTGSEFRADADGSFRLEVKPGAYLVGFPSDRDGPVELAPTAVPVQVEEGGVAFLSLVALRATHFEGLVVDPAGRPLPDVEVSADGVTSASDEDGLFWIGPVGAGEHRLVATPAQRTGFIASEELFADPTDADIVLRVRQGGEIRGVVRGTPSARIELRRVGSSLAEDFEFELTRSDGSFELPGLHPGIYQGYVETDEFRLQVLTDLRVEAGKTLELELDPGPAGSVHIQGEGDEELGASLVLVQAGVEIDEGYVEGGEKTWLRAASGPAILIQKQAWYDEDGLRIPLFLLGGQDNEVTLTLDE